MSVKRASPLNSNTNHKSVKKNIRFEHSLVRDIELFRPDNISFSSWVKSACRDRCLVEGMIAKSSNPPSVVYVNLIMKLHERGNNSTQIAWKLNCIGVSSTEGKKWTGGDVESILAVLS